MRLRVNVLIISLFAGLFCMSNDDGTNPIGSGSTDGEFFRTPGILTTLGDTATLTDADIAALFPDPQVPSPRDDAYYRIDQALSAGTITEEQALVLNIQAAFAPDSLPATYQSSSLNPGLSQADRLVARAFSDSTLSESTREQLDRYLGSATDASTGFVASVGLSKKGASSGRAEACGTASWELIKVAVGARDSAVIIGYEVTPTLTSAQKSTQESKAKAVEEAILEAWSKFEFLLGIAPKAPIHITLAHPSERLGYYGVAFPKNAGIYRMKLCYNQDYRDHNQNIVRESDNHHLRSVTVHELFHIFQYALSKRFTGNSDGINWLTESAATWTEEYIYPANNSEHERHDAFFFHLHKEFINGDSLRWYGNYMWWRFLEQHLETTSHIATVHRALANQSGVGVKAQIENLVADFPSLYAEFARYNWNTKPNVVYSDVPSMPASPLALPKVITGRAETLMHDTLAPGGMVYHPWAFKASPESISRLTIAFNPAHESELVKRQALVLVGDTWFVEEYSGRDTVEYCRHSATERVKALVVIFSNGDLNMPGAVDYTIDTRKQCDTRLTGMLNVEASYTSSDGSIIHSATLTSLDEVEYDKAVDAYRLVRRNTNYSSQYVTDMGEILPGVPMRGSGVENGSVSEYYESGQGPIRFALGSSPYMVIDAETESKDWVTSTTSLEGGGSHSEKTTPATTWKGSYGLGPDHIFGDRIRGIKEVTEIGLFPVEIKITFEYVFPPQ